MDWIIFFIIFRRTFSVNFLRLFILDTNKLIIHFINENMKIILFFLTFFFEFWIINCQYLPASISNTFPSNKQSIKQMSHQCKKWLMFLQ
jgi:hypothetical protein